jgi:hypothetical protein
MLLRSAATVQHGVPAMRRQQALPVQQLRAPMRVPTSASALRGQCQLRNPGIAPLRAVSPPKELTATKVCAMHRVSRQ